MADAIPPLNALQVFEAAGRHLSFKKAAAELHVTPSAVSHRIKTLEDQIGAKLFVRSSQGLALSAAGAAYLGQVAQAFDLLAKATKALPGRRANGRLSVSVAPTFGARWLVPKLKRFAALHPKIEVSIDTARRRVEFLRDGIDVAIRMGRTASPGLYSIRLAQESLVPVCAPRTARRIRTPVDLRGETLLHLVGVADDWASWFALADCQAPDLTRGLRFDTVHMALEAAAQGLGIAIGRLPLVAGDLAAGTLTAVLGPPRVCQTAYWFVADPGSMERPEIVAFRDWIRTEIEDRDAER